MERCHSLTHDEMQVVWHDGVGKQLKIGKGDLMAKKTNEFRPQSRSEKRLAPLQPSGQVEYCPRKMGSLAP
jgi:hypothetical protein